MKTLSQLLAVTVSVLLSCQALANGADDIMIMEPYTRAVPEGQPNSASFMMLHNQGDTDHAVVAAHSDISKVVELHTHINENGMMRMRQIERIEIPAGQHTELKPGGLHVMFMGLNRQLKEGESVT